MTMHPCALFRVSGAPQQFVSSGNLHTESTARWPDRESATLDEGVRMAAALNHARPPLLPRECVIALLPARLREREGGWTHSPPSTLLDGEAFREQGADPRRPRPSPPPPPVIFLIAARPPCFQPRPTPLSPLPACRPWPGDAEGFECVASSPFCTGRQPAAGCREEALGGVGRVWAA